MRIELNRDALREAVRWVTATAGPGGDRGCAGVAIGPAGHGLAAVAAEGALVAAEARVAASAAGPGRVLVAARLLGGVLASLPGCSRMAVESMPGGGAAFTSGRARFVLPGLDVPGPVVPPPAGHDAEIGARFLAPAVAHAAAAAMRGGKELAWWPELGCVRTVLDGAGTMTLTATDKYRMASASCGYVRAPGGMAGEALIPAAALAAAVKRPGRGPVRLSLEPGRAVLETGTRLAVIRTVETGFPDLSGVTGPAGEAGGFTARAGDLSASLGRVLVTAGAGARVCFGPGGDGQAVIVSSGSGSPDPCRDEAGAGFAEHVPAVISGVIPGVTFSARYVRDGLAFIPPGGRARVAFTGPHGPARIARGDCTGSGFGYLVMSAWNGAAAVTA
jgi:hypothetical protein